MVGTLFHLAWPSLVENLLQTAMGVVTMIMVARLGPAAVAGVGLSNQFLNLLIMSFSGLAVGNTALVARHVGAERPAAAARVARQALLLALGIGLAIGLVAALSAGPALDLLGAEPAVAESGADYLRVVGAGAVLMAIMLVGGGTLRGAGDTVTPMVASLIANGVNVAVAFVLIFGHLGFPALGVVGGAWAAVIARAVGCAVIGLKLARGGRLPPLGALRGWRLDTAAIRRIVQIGGPASLESFTVQVGLMAFSVITVWVSTAALATQQIVFNAAQISQLPGMAFSVAATTLVGQNLGARQPHRAAMAGWLAALSACVWMSGFGVGYAVFAEPWLRFYTADAEIISLGLTIMLMLALCQPIQAYAYVLAGALRGAGDTRTTMWAGLIGMWAFRVPFAWFFGLVLGFGLPGIWIGWFADWILRAAIFIWRFRSGRWHRTLG